ncbi:MAG TPA: DUF58 domain-containing protein [candidate division Zixibacteria bacterium]|nr:DUF58 domain-containing protein [candidate division Zixibacteria bacterium]
MSGWVALAILIGAVGALAGAPGLLLVAAVTLAYGTLTRLWTRYGMQRVLYARRLSADRAVAGDSLTLDVTIWNRKPLPLPWVAADDLVSETLPVRERPTMDRDNQSLNRRILHNAWSLAWYERVIRHFHLDDLRRGVYELGPVRLRVRDILGRDASEEQLQTSDTLIVAPRSLPLRGAGPEAAPLGERRARRSLHADPALYGGVRPFQPGDSLRRVHWRATARLGQPVSRRYEPARGRQVVLVLDVQTIEGPEWEMVWDEPAFEGMCVAAASLARSLLDDGAAVGLAAASFSGTTQRFAWLPPQAAPAQLGRVGRLLARIGPVTSAPFGTLLTWLTRRVSPGATLLVLTARDPVPHLPALRRLARMGYALELVACGTDAARHATVARRAAIPARTVGFTPDPDDPEHADAIVLAG